VRVTEYPRPFWTVPRLIVLFIVAAAITYWIVR